MKKLLLVAMLAAFAWMTWGREDVATASDASITAPTRASAIPEAGLERPAPQQFSCDGRTHCSQMRSCAEAEYFIRHCPNTKMDGDNDGEPCESQWCPY